jgi:hypothetical protein
LEITKPVIKFKIKYKGKFYHQVHSFDVRWNVVSFTGEENRIISLNYQFDPVEIYVLIEKDWIKIK